MRTVGLLLAILAVASVGIWYAARPTAPDAFARAARPAGAKPGDLIGHEPFTRGVPAGARAWRILYATTRADGTPATSTGIVMVRGDSATPRDVIAWAHGTTGIAPGCGPTLMGRPFANVPALRELLAEGWAFVATDYIGLGTPGTHAYLVGEEAARNVLDSIRAARTLPMLTLAERTVVWGHSQGGHSALWTGERAGQLAPDIPIAGVAALAPASDLVGLFQSTRSSLFGRIVSSYAVAAYGDTYADIADAGLLRYGIGWLAHDIASRCVGEWQTLVSIAQALLLPSEGILSGDPGAGPLGQRLRENTPQGRIPMPLFIAQGTADDLVLPAIQMAYVAARCAQGQRLVFRPYEGRDHVSLVASGSPLTPDLMAWTRDRFAGKPAETRCPQP